MQTSLKRLGFHFILPRKLNITMTSRTDVRLTCGCSFCYLSHGLVRVCEVELSHMGENSANKIIDRHIGPNEILLP